MLPEQRYVIQRENNWKKKYISHFKKDLILKNYTCMLSDIVVLNQSKKLQDLYIDDNQNTFLHGLFTVLQNEESDKLTEITEQLYLVFNENLLELLFKKNKQGVPAVRLIEKLNLNEKNIFIKKIVNYCNLKIQEKKENIESGNYQDSLKYLESKYFWNYSNIVKLQNFFSGSEKMQEFLLEGYAENAAHLVERLQNGCLSVHLRIAISLLRKNKKFPSKWQNAINFFHDILNRVSPSKRDFFIVSMYLFFNHYTFPVHDVFQNDIFEKLKDFQPLLDKLIISKLLNFHDPNLYSAIVKYSLLYCEPSILEKILSYRYTYPRTNINVYFILLKELIVQKTHSPLILEVLKKTFKHLKFKHFLRDLEYKPLNANLYHITKTIFPDLLNDYKIYSYLALTGKHSELCNQAIYNIKNEVASYQQDENFNDNLIGKFEKINVENFSIMDKNVLLSFYDLLKVQNLELQFLNHLEKITFTFPFSSSVYSKYLSMMTNIFSIEYYFENHKILRYLCANKIIEKLDTEFVTSTVLSNLNPSLTYVLSNLVNHTVSELSLGKSKNLLNIITHIANMPVSSFKLELTAILRGYLTLDIINKTINTVPLESLSPEQKIFTNQINGKLNLGFLFEQDKIQKILQEQYANSFTEEHFNLLNIQQLKEMHNYHLSAKYIILLKLLKFRHIRLQSYESYLNFFNSFIFSGFNFKKDFNAVEYITVGQRKSLGSFDFMLMSLESVLKNNAQVIFERFVDDLQYKRIKNLSDFLLTMLSVQEDIPEKAMFCNKMLRIFDYFRVGSVSKVFVDVLSKAPKTPLMLEMTKKLTSKFLNFSDDNFYIAVNYLVRSRNFFEKKHFSFVVNLLNLHSSFNRRNKRDIDAVITILNSVIYSRYDNIPTQGQLESIYYCLARNLKSFENIQLYLANMKIRHFYKRNVRYPKFTNFQNYWFVNVAKLLSSIAFEPNNLYVSNVEKFRSLVIRLGFNYVFPESQRGGTVDNARYTELLNLGREQLKTEYHQYGSAIKEAIPELPHEVLKLTLDYFVTDEILPLSKSVASNINLYSEMSFDLKNLKVIPLSKKILPQELDSGLKESIFIKELGDDEFQVFGLDYKGDKKEQVYVFDENKKQAFHRALQNQDTVLTADRKEFRSMRSCFSGECAPYFATRATKLSFLHESSQKKRKVDCDISKQPKKVKR